MKKSNIINPSLSVLKQDQLERIHSDSLKVLSDVGVRIESKRVRKIFSDAVGPNAVKNNIVYIPEELVAHALKVAPSSVDLYNRKGDLVIHQPEKVYFGMGVTTLYYQDPQTDTIESFNREHMEICVRLANHLKNFDFITTPGILQDVPPEVADLYAVLEMTANTTKPLSILVSERDQFPAALGLLEMLHGDLTSKPFVVPLVTPITPLVMDPDTVSKMLVTIERGLPLIYLSYGMAGATTPITPAGTLTLLNAELLAGLTISQLVREGAPLIPGYIAGFMDMKSLGNF
jgi:trimethylamine--corrinoid protein Co-methyltransferase